MAMLAVTHMTAGAAIGKALARPMLACPVALASHFVMDSIPHLGLQSAFRADEGRSATYESVAQAIATIVGIVLVMWLAYGQPSRRAMLASALFAEIPDIMFNVSLWNTWFSQWPATAWLGLAHDFVDHHVAPGQWFFGLATQAVIIGIALWSIRRKRTRDRRVRKQGGSGA